MTTVRNSRVLGTIPLLLIVVLFCPFARAKVIYVDDDVTGANSGTSWIDAYIFLQDALAEAIYAEKPVEIRVAQGIYKPDIGGGNTLGEREATFQLINGISLKGGYAGFGEVNLNVRDFEVYETVLSGDLSGDDVHIRNPRDPPTTPSRRDNSYHVVSDSGTDSTAILDGFIITGGNADGAGSNGYGGGMYSHQGNPRLTNCVFTKNSATWGGGMCNQYSSPELINCVFSENWASSHGGGLCNIMSNPTVIDCTFMSNAAFWRGGGITYRTSTATGRGGATIPPGYVADSESSLHNCVFSGNSAYGGGAISNNLIRMKLLNCVFSGNAANTDRGGAICNYSPGETTLTNCTVSGNRAANYAGGIYGGVRTFINNCIVWANTTEKPSGVSEQIQAVYNIDYSCIQGFMDARIQGQGNIVVDPCFADPGCWNPNGTPDDPNDDFWIDGDYHLKSEAGRWDPNTQTWVVDDVTSPCIDAGDPNSPIASEPYPNGGIVNMGAYGSTAEASKSPSGLDTQYGGGTGEPNDPYLIYTAEQLNAIGAEPNDWDKHFKLMADVGLAGYSYDKALIAPDINKVELDFQGSTFTGVFDGDGHTISGLTIAGESYLGLFGSLAPDAHVRDLGVLSASVAGTGNAVGILAGRQSGSIMRCYSTGIVEGNSRVGGLVGYNLTLGYNWNQEVHIASCYSTATVSGNDMVAGLVGENDGTVSECYSTGSVSRNARVDGRFGGLVVAPLKQGARGSYYGGVVINSFWDVKTSGQGESGGGFSRSTTQMQDIKTYRDVGWDFLGERSEGLHDTWQIPDGGGYPVLSIFDGYTPPTLLGTGTSKDPYRITTVAELSAIIYYPRAACYRLENDIDLSGVVWPVAVIPEFSGIFDGNGHVIQNLTVSGAYFLGLFGRLNPRTRIMDLGVVDANVTGTSINIGILVGISISGSVTNSYSHGTVDGSGIVGGLVGYNWSNVSFVTNCYSNSTVSGYRDSGGLIGANAGRIAECCSAGSVNGNNDIGGLVGENRGFVTNCYSTTTTNGHVGVGGLIGFNNVGYPGGHIEHCYSAGLVNGEEKIGGLVGHAKASVQSSFWDTETSGQATSGGGVGKTTAEMQKTSTFLEAGWDFVDETANGTDDIWWIDEGQDYPRLWWEFISEH